MNTKPMRNRLWRCGMKNAHIWTNAQGRGKDMTFTPNAGCVLPPPTRNKEMMDD